MTRLERRRLAKYKRHKDGAQTSSQFLKWSLRYHQLSHRVIGAPNLWGAR